MIRDLLKKVFPLRIIGGEGDVYLERYYIAGEYPAQYWPDPVEPRLPWLPFTLYLHRFNRPDLDRELHNHPWAWAVSLILRGGYIEERNVGERATTVRRLRPGMLNVIKQNTFHRVLELCGPEVWTLFFSGPKVDTWGFKDFATGSFEYMPWREHFVLQEAVRKHAECVDGGFYIVTHAKHVSLDRAIELVQRAVGGERSVYGNELETGDVVVNASPPRLQGCP